MDAVKEISKAPMSTNFADVIKGTLYAILSVIAGIFKLIVWIVRKTIKALAKMFGWLARKVG